MKKVCMTMDLEPDFGGRHESFESLKDNDYFFEFIKEKKIKLTTFVTGSLLDRRHRIINRLMDAGSEFELHSYSHDLNGTSQSEEIIRSRKAYINYFKKKPKGYRAPMGILKKKDMILLKELGFRYDSSIHPTYIPGRYSNLRYPNNPFYLKDTNLIELPISTTRIIRVPLSMLYIQMLGISPVISLIRLFGLNDTIVFNFHMWNLKKNPNIRKLPLKWRTLFSINQDKGFCYLKKMFNMFSKKGYKSTYMSDMLKDAEALKEKGGLKGFR